MFNKCGIGAICYYVGDIEKTEKFYRETLGLDVQRMDAEGEGDNWLLAKTANEVELLFFRQESRSGDSPVVVFNIDEGGIDDIVSSLSEQGVTIVTPVSQAPGGWSADFEDPDGHVLSMYQLETLPRSLS